jgi:hypothetical protein
MVERHILIWSVHSFKILSLDFVSASGLSVPLSTFVKMFLPCKHLLLPRYKWHCRVFMFGNGTAHMKALESPVCIM